MLGPMLSSSISKYQECLKRFGLAVPRWHVVLGSGFGLALDGFPWELAGEISFAEFPDLHRSSVVDHSGTYRFYRRGNDVLSFQLGRLHGYEGHTPAEVVRTVMIPRLAGVGEFLLTNASGGLDKSFAPGNVMVIRDHVNLTGKNPLVGPNPRAADGTELGPRFPDLGNLYDPAWSAALAAECLAVGLEVKEGTYLGLLGPSFETPAEVRLFASWGLHAVGMSTVWEAIALRHSGAKVAGLSLISNLAAGLSNQTLDHHAILATSRASASRVLAGIARAAERA